MVLDLGISHPNHWVEDVTLDLYNFKLAETHPDTRGPPHSGLAPGSYSQMLLSHRSPHCYRGISHSPSSPACPSLFGAIYLIATPHDGLFKGERSTCKPVKAIT